VATKSGIGFTNMVVPSSELRIMTYPYFYNGGGVATGDINNDGLVDIFFTSNQGEDQLYLNRGGLNFEDISVSAGISNEGEWHTGVNMVDVNADGWLDIYVCVVSGVAKLSGHNKLYINQGNLTFVEQAKEYGLDFSGQGTQSAFFDFDRDGDLDCYLLNHATHDAFSSYTLTAKNVSNEFLGDRFYLNDQGTFKNITTSVGIKQAYNGFGLGVVVSDFNNDNWPDLYVSNDFLEDDFLYINQQGQGFKETAHTMFGHISKFSMGVDAADFNNDGLSDIMTLDMRSNAEEILKTSTGEDPQQVYEYKISQGYLHQYAQNCLQLNLDGQKFSEIASFAGVSATDWSWSVLFADYDLDGNKDLFISNGIPHRPNNYDFVNYIYDKVRANSGPEDFNRIWDEATLLMPNGAMHNYIYQGKGTLQFEDKSSAWGFTVNDYCNGTAYADLDNDGDLDLVANQLNNQASLWVNNTISKDFLRIKLQGKAKNLFALGAKVYVWQQGSSQYQELNNTRGFLSSVDHTLIFGLHPYPIDSVTVIWPDGQNQTLLHPAKNETLSIKQQNSGAQRNSLVSEKYLERLPDLNYTHVQDKQSDFLANPLQIFDLSKIGPAVAVGDINNDDLDDFFVGGASGQVGLIWLQTSQGNFVELPQPVFENDAVCEDSDAVFLDVDNDGDADLYVASGGNQVPEFLTDRIYYNNGEGQFTAGPRVLPMFSINTACVRPADFDKDGDVDLFVGGRNIKNKYGISPRSYLFKNNGGMFEDVTESFNSELINIGMVTDASWVDIDLDNSLDLVVVGDWMAPTFFINKGTAFTMIPQNNSNRGLWKSVHPYDFDQDGDQDLVLGNHGLNSSLFVSHDPHLKLFLVHTNEQNTSPILAYQRGSSFYPVHAKDELTRVFPALGKKFTNYKDFATKTVQEVFGELLKNAQELDANQFGSLYLENIGGGQFKEYLLPPEAQVSTVNTMTFADINLDGRMDILVAGNNYQMAHTQTRNDAANGCILLGLGGADFSTISPSESGFWADGEITHLRQIDVQNNRMLIAARNNDRLLLFSMPPNS
jgi:hypothetical protein